MKMKKPVLLRLSAVFVAALALSACKKEYDTPPLATIPQGNILTIDSLRNWQASEGSVSISQDYSVYGVVTMDESDGNIYKNIYMEDATGGINVRLLTGGGVYQGDSIRIYLKGCVLSDYNGVLQLDSVDVDNNIVKQETNVNWAPQVVTIDQIKANVDNYESELVQLNNVQFTLGDLNGTYADATNQTSKNITLEDVNGNTILVRTSGYASFAGEQVAQGSGSLIAIVSEYNGEVQLYIRSYSELAMSGARFAGLVAIKDFDDDDLWSGGWSVVQVIGSLTWETSTAGGAPDPYASISNYDGGNFQTESWLISPSLDLSTTTSPYLNFENAYNYTGDPLQVLVSVDYTGTGDPNGYTWINLTSAATWSTGGWAWANSGDINLAPYISSNVHIAFKYTGTTTSGSTWEVDDILIHG